METNTGILYHKSLYPKGRAYPAAGNAAQPDDQETFTCTCCGVVEKICRMPQNPIRKKDDHFMATDSPLLYGATRFGTSILDFLLKSVCHKVFSNDINRKYFYISRIRTSFLQYQLNRMREKYETIRPHRNRSCCHHPAGMFGTTLV
jgi:hypothetical protein